MRMLVLYYSWSNGNTAKIARELAESCGADLEKIDTVKPYKGSYDEVVAQGKKETEEGFEPALQPLQHDPHDYDVIAVGTPTWWYTMAPAVKSFFAQYDLTGKKVIPFMTNAGWPGHVIKDMSAAAEGAEVICPMEIQFDARGGSTQKTPAKKVKQWMEEIRKKVQ